MLPAIGVRAVEGRVGSTLLMHLLASSPEVVLDRRYPYGEYRYLSYCVRVASFITQRWRADFDPGITEFFFGEAERFGPLPFEPESLDREDLRRGAASRLWAVFGEAMWDRDPSARWYAEKLAVPIEPIVDAGIPLRVIDCMRDPRDVLVSIRAFTAKTGFDGFGRRGGEAEDEYLPRFVANFARQLDGMAATDATVERTTLRYEDFVIDAPGTASRLGEWLEVTLDPEVADRSHRELAHHRTSESVDASIGRWRRELPSDEAETIWTSLASRLEPYGYTEQGI